MPIAKTRGGKQSIDTRQKKENVAEKVKELKLRQQNWMKQRQQQLVVGDGSLEGSGVEKQRSQTADDGRNNTSEKAEFPRSRTTESRSVRTDDHAYNSPTKPPPAKPSDAVNTRGKFQNWLKVRHDQPDNDTHHQADSSSKEHSPLCVLPRDAGFCDSHDSAEELRSRLLAPEDFDNLADKIVSRAQRELQSKSHTSEHGIEVSSVNRRQGAGMVPGVNDISNKSCHHCSCCSQIMIGSENTPMLLIPCGHTVCRQCCQGRELCPECYSRMVSATCNIMLQQIIQEYQGKRGASSMTPPPRTYRIKDQYSPHNYQDHGKVTASTPQRHQYREQLQNLKTRLEVLTTERSSVDRECERLSESIKQEAHQLRNITKQEDNVCSQITSLEDKLALLRQHKSEYQSRCSGLKTEREDAQRSLAMLRETMQALHNEMEKVKLLSEA